MANLGFIGLGTMGSPMADHLIKAGHRVFLDSRSGVLASLVPPVTVFSSFRAKRCQVGGRERHSSSIRRDGRGISQL